MKIKKVAASLFFVFFLLNSTLFPQEQVNQSVELLIQKGHSGAITSLAITQDGKQMVSGSDDKTIKLWDLETGKITHAMVDKSGIGVISITPDGKRIVFGSGDKFIKLWDLETGKIMHTMLDTSGIGVISITPDGRRIVFGNGEKSIKLWDLESNKIIDKMTGHLIKNRDVILDIIPDGKLAVNGRYDGTIELWDFEADKLIRTITGLIKKRDSISITPDGKRAITWSIDGTIWLWNLETGKPIRPLEGHKKREDAIYSYNRPILRWEPKIKYNVISISPNGTRAVAESNNGNISLWNLKNGKLIRTMAGYDMRSNVITISSDGTHAVAGSDDGTIRLWNLETGALIRTMIGRAEKCVNTVAIATDGKRIISGNRDKTIKIWDMETGKLIQTLTGHTREVNTVVLTPDGNQIISESEDRTIKFWDLKTGKLILSLPMRNKYEGKSAAINPDSKWDAWSNDNTSRDGYKGGPIAITPDGKFIVLGNDNIIELWNLEFGHLIGKFEGHKNSVEEIANTPDGKKFISRAIDNVIKLWDLETGSFIRDIKLVSKVNAIAITPDSKQIVFGISDSSIKLWDIETDSVIRSMPGHEGEINTVVITPDGKQIVSGSDDSTIKLWDLESGKLIRTLIGHENSVKTIAVTFDGKHIVSGGEDGDILLWDILDGKQKAHIVPFDENQWIAYTPDNNYTCSPEAEEYITFRSGNTIYPYSNYAKHFKNESIVTKTFQSILPAKPIDRKPTIKPVTNPSAELAIKKDELPILSLAVTSDSRRLVSGSADKTIKLWNLETGTLIHTMAGHDKAVMSFTIANDNKWIVSICGDNTIKLWNLETGTLIRNMSGGIGENVNSIAVTPDSKQLVSGNKDATVKLWDLETGNLIFTMVGHTSSVNAVTITPDGKWIISSGGLDKTIKLWDLETGAPIRDLTGHEGEVNAIAISPDGKRLFSGSKEKSMKLWDLETGTVIRSIQGPYASLNFVTITNDGKWIVTSGEDEIIKFWDLESGTLIRKLEGQTTGLKTIAIISDGKHIITGNLNGEIFLRNSQDGKVKAAITQFNENQWIAYTPENYYTCSPGAEKNVTFRYCNMFSPASIFSAYFKNEAAVAKVFQSLLPEKTNTNNYYLTDIKTVPIASSKSSNSSYLSTKKNSLREFVRNIFGKSRSWAVVIGIDNYSKMKNGFDYLPYAVNDAKAIKDYLIQSLGFSEEKIFPLYNEAATKKRIEQLLGETLPKKVSVGDRVLIYFSGHGGQEVLRANEQCGYLIPIDGNINSMYSTCISMYQLQYFSEKNPARQMLFIFDSCFSGLAGVTYKKGITNETRDQVEAFIRTEGRQVLTAGGADDIAVMDKKWNNHSVFTFYLLKGLRGDADYNNDGVISVHELQLYLENTVPKAAKQHPTLKDLKNCEGQFIFYREGEL